MPPHNTIGNRKGRWADHIAGHEADGGRPRVGCGQWLRGCWRPREREAACTQRTPAGWGGSRRLLLRLQSLRPPGLGDHEVADLLGFIP